MQSSVSPVSTRSETAGALTAAAENSDESAPLATDTAFSVGQRVRARFAGKKHWYNGVVTTVNADGTYGLEYDDGDWEDSLGREYITPLNSTGEGAEETLPAANTSKFEVQRPGPHEVATRVAVDPGGSEAIDRMVMDEATGPMALSIGQRVRAQFAGKAHFYNGKIIAVNADGTYGVEYDDGDWEDALERHFIQAIGATAPNDKNCTLATPERVAQEEGAADSGSGTVPPTAAAMLATTWDGGAALSSDGTSRPKSRGGRSRPLRPTGRYPWQQPSEPALEDAPSTPEDPPSAAVRGPAVVPSVDVAAAKTVVTFLDDGTAMEPNTPTGGAAPSTAVSSKYAPPPKARAQSASPKRKLVTTGAALDTFIDRNRRAVALATQALKESSNVPAPPSPPPAARPPAADRKARGRPEWCSSIKADEESNQAKIPTGSAGKKGPTAMKLFPPSQAEVTSTARYEKKKRASTSRSPSPVRRPASAPGGKKRGPDTAHGMAKLFRHSVSDVDRKNAAYFFACKVVENGERDAVFSSTRGGVAGCAERVKEPRIFRLYKRESELFEQNAVVTRRTLKAIRAIVRDKEKIDGAIQTLATEIAALRKETAAARPDVVAADDGRTAPARGDGAARASRGARAPAPASPVDWEVEALCRKAKMRILKNELGSGFDRYAMDLTLLFRKLRGSLARPSTTSARNFRFDDMEEYLVAESRREGRERQHRNRERVRRQQPWTRANEQREKEEAREAAQALDMRISGTALLKSLYLFCEDVVKALSGHERAILLAHFDTDGKGMVDVREFMDALRPSLSAARQARVDLAFQRFQRTDRGVRLQATADGEAAAVDARLPAIDVVDGQEVWAAYAAFRALVPPEHPRGHAALAVLDAHLTPVSEARAKKALPAAAEGAVTRDEWDALHRSLSLRVPSDAVFEALLDATWAFAGEARVPSAEEGFGLPEDKTAFLTEVEIVADKQWEEFAHTTDEDGTRPFWYCAETGERTWEMPSSLKRQAMDAARKKAVRRKEEAKRQLEEMSKAIDGRLAEAMGKYDRAEDLGRYGVPGLNARPLAVSHQGLTGFPHLFRADGDFLNLFWNHKFTHMNLDDNAFGESVELLDHWLDTAFHVQELSVCRNGLPWLPTGTGGALKHLTVLRAADNLITQFPLPAQRTAPGALGEYYANFAALAELDLGGNRLVELTPEIRFLSGLRVLNLAGNQLSTLPAEMTALSCLEQLDVSHNRVATLPAGLATMDRLVSLDLRENKLVTLPSTIGGLTSLQYLNVKSNQLTAFPQTFCALAGLIALDASFNALESLPTKFGELRALKRLDLHQNSLSKLPHSMYRLAGLEELYVNSNRLERLPEIEASDDDGGAAAVWAAVKVVCLQKNQLVQLPERIGSIGTTIVSMKLHENALRELPASIGACTKLEQLHLANNQLEKLPGSFQHLTALSDVTLHGNPLTPGLQQVVQSGTFVSPAELQLRRCTSKVFDAIRSHWPAVEDRIARALKKNRGSRMSPPRRTAAGSVVAQAVARAEGPPGKAPTARTKTRSLSIAYRRLRDALLQFDSDAAGTLSPSEFARAIEAVGMFLSKDDCDMMTMYAQETCATGQSLLDIDRFVHALHTPPSSGGGVAQAVVRFCHAAAVKHQHQQARQADRARSGASAASTLRQRETELNAANAELARQVRELEHAKQVARRKAEALQHYVAGEGPLPEWVARGGGGGEEDFHGVMVEVDPNGVPVRERILQKRAVNERLQTQQRALANEIRRKNAEVRRLESDAEQQRQQQAGARAGAQPQEERTGQEAERRRRRMHETLRGARRDTPVAPGSLDAPGAKERVAKKLRAKQAREKRAQELEARRAAVKQAKAGAAQRKNAREKRRENDVDEHPPPSLGQYSEGARLDGTPPPDPDAPRRINMMIMGSAAPPFSIVAVPDETVGELKAKVEFREGLPVGRQSLFHRQKRLADTTTVRSAKMRAGDTVHIVVTKTSAGGASATR